MAGFENDIVYAKNADFSQADNNNAVEANGLITNGQLWIGTTNVNVGGTHVNVGSITSPDNSLTIGYSSPNITATVTAGNQVLKTLSDDSNVQVQPALGNIQLVGHVFESDGTTKIPTVTAGTNLLNLNPMTSSRWIVDPNGFNGTHTTITSAIASASSGDTIILMSNSTFTENFTVDKSLTFFAYGAQLRDPTTNLNVEIIGKVTVSANDLRVFFNGIKFTTNSDNSFLLSGQSQITCQNCYFNASNSNSISATGSSANFYIENCSGTIASTFTLFISTGTLIWIKNSQFIDTAGTLAASTISANSINLINSSFTFPFSTSSTGYLQANQCRFGPFSNVTNQTWLTTAGNQVHFIEQCQFYSGTSSAISVGAGTTVDCNQTIINSSNTNAITGAGILTYSCLSFLNSSVMNVTTQTAAYTQLGKWKASGQPCVYATKSAATTNATGDGTNATVIFDVEVFDLDNNYNPATGVFTAPVTGKYFVSGMAPLSAFAGGATACDNRIIATSRTIVGMSLGTSGVALGYNAYVYPSCTAVVDMVAGDTLVFSASASGGTKTVSVQGGGDGTAHLSIFLVA